jgi:hypothetical protein
MSVRIAALALSVLIAGAAGSTASEAARWIETGPVQLVQFGGQGTWTRCASEDHVCYVPYPTTVRYGTNGRYYSLPVAGFVPCSNQIFGDPYRGRGKHCDFLTVGFAPGGYGAAPQLCAREDGYCAFRGTARVLYGANDRFTARILTNGTPCNNSVFGDPAVGSGKACYIAP